MYSLFFYAFANCSHVTVLNYLQKKFSLVNLNVILLYSLKTVSLLKIDIKWFLWLYTEYKNNILKQFIFSMVNQKKNLNLKNLMNKYICMLFVLNFKVKQALFIELVCIKWRNKCKNLLLQEMIVLLFITLCTLNWLIEFLLILLECNFYIKIKTVIMLYEVVIALCIHILK